MPMVTIAKTAIACIMVCWFEAQTFSSFFIAAKVG